MARMVRKQIVLDAELERELAARAEVLGVSQSEVVRRAVSRYLKPSGDASRRLRAFEDLQAMWEESERLRVGSGGARWTREEIHERPGAARHEHPGVRGGR